MTLDERAVRLRHRASHRAFLRLCAGGSPGAELTELPGGVLALRCPARPERSFVNCVIYDDDIPALERALPELARWYDEAGVQAWTVWVQAGDAEAAAVCEAAGHVLDATPELMWAPLDEPALDVPVPADVELRNQPSWREVGDLNDAAYGLPPDHLVVALDGADEGAALRTVAVVGGRAVACAVVNVVGEDAHVSLVATLPEHRERGLAAACMASGLRRARADGATTTTLEATQAGRPVYRRMGYRELGAMGMWERRRVAGPA